MSFYGELHVLGRDYLLSQHADPKLRGRVPTVFVTPLQDFSGSTAWFVQGRKTLVSAAQTAGCPWEQCIELGHWGCTALDSSFLLPQEDMRRKKALECLSMPKRYNADARLRRVARIVGNQIQGLAAYLRAKPPVAAAQTFDTMWELMPQYNRFAEGS